VSLTGQTGFSGVVSVTVNGLPTGVIASPSSFSYAIGTSQPIAITFSPARSAALGSTPVDINGSATINGGQVTHDSTVTLTVAAAPPNDFSISTDVGSRSIGIGASDAVKVTISAVGSTPATVQVTLSATVPAGLTASFSLYGFRRTILHPNNLGRAFHQGIAYRRRRRYRLGSWRRFISFQRRLRERSHRRRNT